MYMFGTGALTVVPSGANPTPIVCGVLQDVSLAYKSTQKQLRGSYKFPVAIAESDASITGKAKSALLYGAFLNQVLSGSTIATGTTVGALNEAAVVPSTPFQITVAQAATFVADQGVYDATTGLRLTRVASSPATGQYSVAAGVYTYAAADVGHAMWASYSYTLTTGFTVSFANQLQGQANTFGLTLFNTFNGKNIGFRLFSVVLPGLGLTSKNSDWTMSDLDYEAYANGSGQVLEAYTSE